MTMLSLRIAAKSNAVSVMHQKKALEIWGDHPMEVVTNGVHVPTWDGTIGDDIWKYHTEQKRQLLSYVLTQTGVKLDENTLLLGWARRMVSYKRPLALFQDIERFKKLASDTHRPVRVVMAGFSPPGDADGAALLQQIQYIATHDLKDYLVYLPNYDMEIARHMIAGCDVWLNTPVVGFEACGTSGMKAALNGVFPLSTRDGWVDEAELFRVGWLLDNEKINKSLLSILENDIIPMYYTNRDEWVAHMWNAREMVLNQFSATRMLRGYVEKMYLPTLQALDH
jgi:starch phosphorylase